MTLPLKPTSPQIRKGPSLRGLFDSETEGVQAFFDLRLPAVRIFAFGAAHAHDTRTDFVILTVLLAERFDPFFLPATRAEGALYPGGSSGPDTAGTILPSRTQRAPALPKDFGSAPAGHNRPRPRRPRFLLLFFLLFMIFSSLLGVGVQITWKERTSSDPQERPRHSALRHC